MSLAAHGYGKSNVVGGVAAHGFGIKVVVPFFQKLRTFLVKITRMRMEEVRK